MTTWRRTTTPPSASPRTPPRPTSRRPTASSPPRSTPTATPATPRPRSGSRGLRGLRRAVRRGQAARVRRAAHAVRQRPGGRRGGGGGSTSTTCSAGRAGGLGDVFSGLFGQGGRRGPARQGPRRGADVEASVTLPFVDALRGVHRAAAADHDRRLRRPAAAAGPRPAPRRAPATCAAARACVTRNQGGFAFAEPCTRLPRHRAGRRRRPAPRAAARGRPAASAP